MKRRKLLTYSAIAAGSAATLGACTAQSTQSGQNLEQPTVRWRMATSWPKSLDTIFGGAETICQRVSEMTYGRFTITPFAAGEIVPGLEVLDAVQQGTVECSHTASYYFVGKNPALGFGTTVPFGLTAQQQNSWLYHGNGLDALNKLYADFNVVSLPAGNTGTQMGGWFKRRIQSVSDLNGLKMRIPGLGGQVMSRLGVNVQVLPGGEIFLALERGAIDAAEWVGPYDDEKLGLNKAAQYYYYPGWWEPGATLEVQVNRSAWDKLPKEYQQVFKTATYEANMSMLAQYDAKNGEALKRLVDSGTQLAAYSPEIMQAAQKATFELYEESAAKDGTFREVYEQWKAFRQQVYGWDQINQLIFANFAIANGQQT
ncbi:TRAP transporter substrate-binding protein [Desertifilum sp. FACHB-1129]|uniref:ABC transporter substrate-binding protein n=2 Tax=Cyanophyceae TaxID=3028117 RepID=A0A1E5QIM5_9CYAN|nr:MULTISPECIES: TRAP transporter substrate-binding protein [Cyanophyceae]MCD8486494.1 TRAP transporter substrate-binding protein [Desertifilum sp.]MDA0210184.1 TRAP transporter substrate-binding protein [Cyanobacteria bacterium FC1]MDL5047256.1 TRAP transporter substrate-binding protein [Oscillatoria amoena NRMC-F 0135]MBD2313591.1 TRAP transporter substrate-binding protein [Desertifilum sp. FACHB-1129]MBD2320588.1 TRAP transporter substrate-binding protein [Desertifilum sp. FACHB-866]